MAPEQANGQGDRIGPRTDVFGLGGVLYALLTGRPPHVAATQKALVEAARQGHVDPPHRHNPRVPRALDRLCQKALAADPEQRLASAEQFRHELLRYLRRPRRILAGLLVAAVLVVGCLIAWFATRSTPPGPVTATPSAVGPLPVTVPQPPPAMEKPPEPPPGWQVYQSKSGGYTVWFPGTPTEGLTEVPSGTGKREVHQAILNDVQSGLYFLVNHADFKDKVFPDAEQALDAARDGAKEKAKAPLLSEQRITLGPHPGRELRFALPLAKGLLLRMRIYLVGQRNYQLLIAGPEKAVEGPSAETFFRSFRLVRDY
jgi:hypothetical protein